MDDGTFTWQSSWEKDAMMLLINLIRILIFVWWALGAPALLYIWVMTQMAGYTAAVRNLHLPLTELIRPIHKLKAQWTWTFGFHCKRNVRVTHQHNIYTSDSLRLPFSVQECSVCARNTEDTWFQVILRAQCNQMDYTLNCLPRGHVHLELYILRIFWELYYSWRRCKPQ